MGAGRRFLMVIACAVVPLSTAAPAWAQTTFHPRLGAAMGLVPPVNSQGRMSTGDVATGSPIPLTYHGGQVMNQGVTVHTIFWAPSGYAFEGSPGPGIPTYEGLIQQFFTDVAHDSGASGTCTTAECNLFTTLPQFGQGTSVGGVTPGSYSISYSAATDSIDDTDGYPPAGAQCASPGGETTCITDGQLRAEIDHVIQSTPGTPRGLTNLWFVFLPPGVDECTTPGNCGTSTYAGYHEISNINGHGVTIYALAIDPVIEVPVSPGSDPEGFPDAETAIGIAAHETIEAMTDPEGAGWMDPDGAESGDKCVSGGEVGTPLGFNNGSPYNQVINSHRYLIQEMWTNLNSAGVSGCVQSTTNTTVQLPLAQVNLRQFNPIVTGNVNRSPGGGIGVRVTLVRPDANGNPVTVARASTTTAANGSWSLSLAPHAPGDDRDEIDVDYSGASAPQPNHQVILTGNGGNPFTEAGWTGWFDLDNGTLLSTGAAGGSMAMGPCFQSGLLAFTFDGIPGQSPTDLCDAQTDTATVGTARIDPSDVLTVSSNDNRAYDAPGAPAPNPLGGLVSLTVPVGEVGSVSPLTSPLAPLFTAGGFPSCTADLEFQGVFCGGLVPGATYTLTDGGQTVTTAADSSGTLVTPIRVRGGDVVSLSNASRTLTQLHVAHLRVNILGEQDSVASGACQAGDYYGAPPADYSTTTVAGLPTNQVSGGVAMTGAICPASGDATGLPTATVSQTDDLSGGQTETEVPDVQDTSPIEGETMYGRFTALAETGLAASGNMSVPTDQSTRVSLQILTASHGKQVFTAKNVDSTQGVTVPALKPGTYIALWLLRDANGDKRLVGTRFVEQLGRVGPAPKAKVACGYTSSRHDQIRCAVRFLHGAVTGSVKVRLSRGSVIVGLGHARVRRSRAALTLKVLGQASSGRWRITLVLARPHLVAATESISLPSVS